MLAKSEGPEGPKSPSSTVLVKQLLFPCHLNRVSTMSGKSGNSQGKPFPRENVRELSGKLGPKCQGNLTLFTDIQEWCNILKSSFCTLMPLSIL